MIFAQNSLDASASTCFADKMNCFEEANLSTKKSTLILVTGFRTKTRKSKQNVTTLHVRGTSAVSFKTLFKKSYATTKTKDLDQN